MTRKEFIKICGLFGLTLPAQNMLLACNESPVSPDPFAGKVIVIGAGAGGLSTGYLLNQQGTDVEILEATNKYGGRMRINTEFADFPIPLGAEWLETKPSVFEKIVNNPSVDVDVETVRDAPDRKFVNYSWYNFFEEYIVPPISNKIRYNTIVQSIDFSGAQVLIGTQDGQFSADKVVISVPLKILQENDIAITPDLPSAKRAAIDESLIWEGFKAFFEFSTNFYSDGLFISSNADGEKAFYNAAHGQNTNSNILGLFAVGTPALDYINLPENQLKNNVLRELDDIYDNQASPNYIKHISQNWNKEPFVRSGYLTDNANWKAVRELGKPVSDKLYFAGGAYTDGEDWVSVHAAALSAKRVLGEINS